jgi:hypothetical protein
LALPSNHPPAPAEDGLCKIGVLERNPKVAQRVARVLRSASALSDVVVESDPATLRSMLSEEPVLLACDASDLDLALEWAETRYRNMSVISWTSSEMDSFLEAARRSSHFAGLIGWPGFSGMPRPWELALATRRLVDSNGAAPRLSELFTWGSTVMKFRPRTSRDRDLVVTEVGSLSERAGAPGRIAQRVGEVAHEMLMNAMYDAPVDHEGRPKYAHDRKQDVDLEDAEAPTFRFASDGVHVALQVVDPFGRLNRWHVLDGVIRGRKSASADEDRAVLDTSGGGAGLGLYRIYSLSTVMIVDVEPHRYTSVTAFFDLEVHPREARSMPVSLHLYDKNSRA